MVAIEDTKSLLNRNSPEIYIVTRSRELIRSVAKTLWEHQTARFPRTIIIAPESAYSEALSNFYIQTTTKAIIERGHLTLVKSPDFYMASSIIVSKDTTEAIINTPNGYALVEDPIKEHQSKIYIYVKKTEKITNILNIDIPPLPEIKSSFQTELPDGCYETFERLIKETGPHEWGYKKTSVTKCLVIAASHHNATRKDLVRAAEKVDLVSSFSISELKNELVSEGNIETKIQGTFAGRPHEKLFLKTPLRKIKSSL